ncbi:MAG: bifunctional 5,10-methylene-tetrahydrofolate dehydrogenase/5,10-methylene-tetrahydrofolate cyclohydrolase [Oscillospiraceae bacterium]|jgi:methylenetetrahydrofolate dehydrogenase (NADP+)/methenyltetrahydrofolate cyclohydrolase|nr:bifunctional 5,10-methylene-tetrahydrofolate dehydrogenase/5,10-methylene-tetrahydrofolate cyclohydrolase [Oscillospiraceae bacterium]
MVFYTKDLVTRLKKEIKDDVELLKKRGIFPALTVIQVGDDFSSGIYVRNKKKACEETGILCNIHHLSGKQSTQNELLSLIAELNNSNIHGILVQLPLPAHLHPQEVLATIDPNKDVDGFCANNVGNLVQGHPNVLPCTPLAVLTILKNQEIEISGKHCVIVGRSNIVGKPMAMLMLNESATVTICHRQTKDLGEFCRSADILICAAGAPKLIKQGMVKPGSVVIDVGISRDENGQCCGDVDFESVKELAGFITPVPGGVGPMTIAMLLKNVLTLTKQQKEKI